MSTVGTAVDRAFPLDAVSDDFTVTMGASWCNSVNSAFEAIEYVGGTGHANLKTLIVVVAAYFAFRHRVLSSRS